MDGTIWYHMVLYGTVLNQGPGERVDSFFLSFRGTMSRHPPRAFAHKLQDKNQFSTGHRSFHGEC